MRDDYSSALLKCFQRKMAAIPSNMYGTVMRKKIPLFKPEPIPPWFALSSPTALHITHCAKDKSAIKNAKSTNSMKCRKWVIYTG